LRELDQLKTAHREELRRVVRENYDRGLKFGIKMAERELGKENIRLAKALHEAAVAKLAERLEAPSRITFRSPPPKNQMATHKSGQLPPSVFPTIPANGTVASPIIQKSRAPCNFISTNAACAQFV
jgi:hypothetical protein